MTTHIVERRRTPRVDLLPDETVRMELRHRVQLLDISLTGALVACEVKLPIGTRGQLRAGLASMPFTAELVVGRHQPRPAQRQVGLGAIFSSMDEQNRRSLEQFLRRGSE
jgi:c-di-GMP-binding flagellar brake protein YcgR